MAAHAQSTAEQDKAAAVAQEGDISTDITVTARRREESIVDVPLAISVVTSSQLQQLDIRDTNALANRVPGLEFSDFTPGFQRNDRGAARTLSFRGLAIGGAASLFLDGAAVSGDEVPAALDIGQVEVLRGPQSVYFGRSTMTGAVSYRTKAVPDHWEGIGETQFAERNTTVLQGTIAGPVVEGLLGVRLTGLYDRSDGYITNRYNGGKLGDRSRRSVSGTISFTPATNVDFKGYVSYFRDNDGASATIFLPASLDNCRLPGAVQNTFCGQIPSRSGALNYVNTTIPANMTDFLFSSPLQRGQGFDRKVGGQRTAFNSHIVGNWTISDYLKLQSITALHRTAVIAVADGIAQPVQPTFPYSAYFYNLVSRARDVSQELRLSSDPERPISWTIGSNYIDAWNRGQALVAFQTQRGMLIPFDQGLGFAGTKTIGLFGGIYAHATDRLTFSAEARYQWDKTATRSQNAAGTVTADLSKTFRSFNPRVSVDYDVGGDRKVYMSYATGSSPGGFNTNIDNYSDNPAALAEIQQKLGLSSNAFDQQKLRIGELGFKGSFANGKGFFDFNGYYGKLLKQQITYGALIEALGVSVIATANVGETEIYGLEFQGNYEFVKGLSLTTTAAWNHSVRTQYVNTSGLQQFGTTDFNGKIYANVPEYSGSAVLAYSRPISDGWNGFTNLSYVYRGKRYASDFNNAYIKGRSQIDLRLGASNDRYTFELFVRNLFDDRGYVSGSINPDYGTGTYNAFFGAVAEPRQLGGRVRVSF